jgi:hypothetical protein
VTSLILDDNADVFAYRERLQAIFGTISDVPSSIGAIVTGDSKMRLFRGRDANDRTDGELMETADEYPLNYDELFAHFHQLAPRNALILDLSTRKNQCGTYAKAVSHLAGHIFSSNPHISSLTENESVELNALIQTRRRIYHDRTSVDALIPLTSTFRGIVEVRSSFALRLFVDSLLVS